MNATPPARPSTPSSQLTVFIIRPSQNRLRVTVTQNGQGAVCCPVNGLLNVSMNIRKVTAMAAAASWARYCGSGPNSKMSSSSPKTKMKSPPSSSPASRIHSQGSNRGTGSTWARMIVAVKPTYSISPPSFGIGLWC